MPEKNEENAEEILSKTTVHMKYAKWMPDLLRRESWEEICQRNLDMHLETFPSSLHDEIIEVYRKFVIPMKIVPSMRSMQFAGKPVFISPNRVYNCAYMPVDSIECFNEAMFLLLGGTGVGYQLWYYYIIENFPKVLMFMLLIGGVGYGFSTVIRIIGGRYSKWSI